MAIVKCKECGANTLSTKAKSCPNCGAPTPKKTSMFTWFILIIILFFVYSSTKSSTTKTASTSNSSSVVAPTETLKDSSKKEPAKVVKDTPKPLWDTYTSRDEMTGNFSAYITSPIAFPLTKMDFPYRDVISWLAIGCNGKGEWAYLGFNSSPNITNDETRDGYNIIDTRIKWDDKVEDAQLTQDWGAKFIHFSQGKETISKIEKSNVLKVELHWHGQQPTYFEYTLNGSSMALAEIRAQCANNK